jgi:hypothetical protein
MEYKGIEESLKYLVEVTSELRKDITDIKSQIQLRAYTLKEIAAGFGYKTEQSLLNKPWKMPNYGKPDLGYHPRKWLYNTIVNWYSIPEEERRMKWETMSSKERRETLGIITTTKKALSNRSTGFHIEENRSKRVG